MHLFDPHQPYDPPLPCDSRFGAGPSEKILGKTGWLEPGDHGETLGELEERFEYAFARSALIVAHSSRSMRNVWRNSVIDSPRPISCDVSPAARRSVKAIAPGRASPEVQRGSPRSRLLRGPATPAGSPPEGPMASPPRRSTPRPRSSPRAGRGSPPPGRAPIAARRRGSPWLRRTRARPRCPRRRGTGRSPARAGGRSPRWRGRRRSAGPRSDVSIAPRPGVRPGGRRRDRSPPSATTSGRAAR